MTQFTTPQNLKLNKCLTGIQGLDEITFGGLPAGRPTLVCGNVGCGKTLLSMEYIANGAKYFNEPGIYMSFEENENDLLENFSSLNFNLQGLINEKKVALEYVYIERKEIEETGEYDLEGLFLRLENAINSIGAKRLVLDTLEALFSGFTNESILRAELRRLFRWIKDKGITAIITAERGERTFTKFGLEEYVADCVIMLDHRVIEQMATRRLKIIKYRGSLHGTNEYPFLIDETGITVLPITSIGLDYEVTSDRISTGIRSLDEMFDKKGFYKNSSILISGSAGTGKTNFACSFVNNTCASGTKCLFFAFEESPNQIIRNANAIGINLQNCIDKGRLKFSATRPNHFGLEMHLVYMSKLINEYNPEVVIIDSVTNLIGSGLMQEVKLMLTRLLDTLKVKKITVLMTNLMFDEMINNSEIGISSLTDTWIKLMNKEKNNELIRTVNVIKSRGMNHSNKILEFKISNNGIKIEESLN
jgi:circadian clock protein KaiC